MIDYEVIEKNSVIVLLGKPEVAKSQKEYADILKGSYDVFAGWCNAAKELVVSGRKLVILTDNKDAVEVKRLAERFPGSEVHEYYTVEYRNLSEVSL